MFKSHEIGGLTTIDDRTKRGEKTKRRKTGSKGGGGLACWESC